MPAKRQYFARVKYADGTITERETWADSAYEAVDQLWPTGYDLYSTIVSVTLLHEEDGSMSEPMGRCQ